MASFMLVRHKVRNFKEWKVGYDSHLPKRVEVGLTERYLLHGNPDPNEVVILFEARDIDRARSFAASPELKARMQEVGVVDKPDIYFLDN
jgi:hypothetical protein